MAFSLTAFARVDTLTHLGYGGTTATAVFDVSESSQFSAVVSFTGVSASNVVGTISVTNNPSAGNTLALALNGTTNTYTWATTPVVYTTNLSVSAPLARFTLSAAPTNGDTLTITRTDGAYGAKTNTSVFTWTTNTPTTQLQIAVGASAAASATNLYAKLNTYGWSMTPPTLSYSSSTAVEVRSAPNLTSYVTNSSTYASTVNTTYYTVTNLVATNSLQVATGAASANAATNLFNKLSSDYSGQLVPAYTSATAFTLTVPTNGALVITPANTWATATVASNWITGSVTVNASNSVDGISWFSDTAKTIVAPFSGTSAVSYQTNFTSVVYPFYKYAFSNPVTNYATANTFRLSVVSKKGL